VFGLASAFVLRRILIIKEGRVSTSGSVAFRRDETAGRVRAAQNS
jgi:hypothetical protein